MFSKNKKQFFAKAVSYADLTGFAPVSFNKNNVKRILLTGGGSGGSVAPLLAVAEELIAKEVEPLIGDSTSSEFEFLWLGAKFGPERKMVEKAGIKFRTISGGKWRRYFSLKNLADIFKIKLGFWQAFFIMLKWRPNLVISAGSFISVPVVWAAWLLRAPVLIHQQDIRPGLANKLMAPLSKIVTVTFESSLKDYGKKAVWTGNPIRRSLEIPNPKSQVPNINEDSPVALIVGGGTGAEAINRLVADSLGELTKFCRIIHVTGKNKSQKLEVRNKKYENYEFLDAERMVEAMKAADLTVTRAGLATLSELSYLGKPSIIIPLPDSPQEANAEFFKNKKAALVLEQKKLTSKDFIGHVKKLLFNEALKLKFKLNIKAAMKKDANKNIAGLIYKII